MKAGRELDALVAEKVMGDVGGQALGPRHYSTDIAAAWEVVEKLSTGDINIHYYPTCTEGVWWVAFPDVGEYSTADTAPLAICLAALKAVGYGSSGSYDASSADGEISNPMAGEST